MENTYNAFLLLGGIALFLYGINFMSQSLYEALGDNLRTILEKLTTRPIKAVLLGVVVTALIQSSGATMVMVSGFVAAQLMTLEQGLYVMVGAAIGTTITAQIIAFKIEPFAPLILFIGCVMYLFIKNRTVKKIGAVILGFGALFMGIYLMGDAVAKMNLGVIMQGFLDRFSNPFITFLFGLVFTFVIQSSSASIGILQVLMSGAMASTFSLGSVVFMIMGMNIGAVAPVVISSLAGNKAGKRAAFAEVVAKVMTALIFVIVIIVWPGSIEAIANLAPGNASRQIANFHLIFNVVGTIVLFPLIKPIAAWLMRLLPDDPAASKYSKKLLYIGKGQDHTPTVMIAQTRQELFRFADLVQENYNNAIQGFQSEDIEIAEMVQEREQTINFLNHQLYQYLLGLHGKLLPENDMKTLGKMFHILTDLERIGDHADNIAGYTIDAKTHHATVSRAAWTELTDMGNKTVEIVDDAITCYKTHDVSMVGKVQYEEDHIDQLKEQLEQAHIERMRHQTCDPHGGTLFIDVIVDFERVADHSLNIVETLVDKDLNEETN